MGKSMVSCRFSQQNQSIDIYKTVQFLGYMLVIKYSSTILFANLGLKAPVTFHIRKYHVDHVDPRQESANEAAKIGDGELRFHGAQSLKSVDLSQSKMIHDLNLSCFLMLFVFLFWPFWLLNFWFPFQVCWHMTGAFTKKHWLVASTYWKEP